MIIVDTNVVSELMKSSPSEPVIEWVRARTGSELFTTSVTLAEISVKEPRTRRPISSLSRGIRSHS